MGCAGIECFSEFDKDTEEEEELQNHLLFQDFEKSDDEKVLEDHEEFEGDSESKRQNESIGSNRIYDDKVSEGMGDTQSEASKKAKDRCHEKPILGSPPQTQHLHPLQSQHHMRHLSWHYSSTPKPLESTENLFSTFHQSTLKAPKDAITLLPEDCTSKLNLICP